MSSVILKQPVFIMEHFIFSPHAFLWQTCWLLIFRFRIHASPPDGHLLPHAVLSLQWNNNQLANETFTVEA